MLFCIYALKRGPNQRLFPRILCSSTTTHANTKGDQAEASGPDLSVWASGSRHDGQGSGSEEWGQRVYLTDLKRQSMGHQVSEVGYDQRGRVEDWQTGAGYSHDQLHQHQDPQGDRYGQRNSQIYHEQQQQQGPTSINQNGPSARWSAHTPSPLGSGYPSPGQISQTRSSPASTFHTHSHLLPPSRSLDPGPRASTPPAPKRGSSLPKSPLVSSTRRLQQHSGGSFGHTPSMYAGSIWSTDGSGAMSGEVSVPPIAKVAYSPFTPRGSLSVPSGAGGGQRVSVISERGFAV